MTDAKLLARNRHVLILGCLAVLSPPLAKAEFGCPPGTSVELTALLDEIEALPEGGWMRANANRYDEVWTPLALRPSSGPLFSTPSMIIQAWSSFAWDCRRGDILLYGGGHANYSGNDTYRWRATTRRWERMSLPSQIQTDAMGNTTAIDGPFAAPAAAHTYDNNVYLPFVDRFLVLGGSVWNTGGAYEFQTGPDTDRITGPYTFDLNKADGAKVGGTTGSHVQSTAPYPEIVGGEMWQNRDLYSLLPLSSLPSNHTSGTTAYAGATGNSDVVFLTARQGLATAQHLFRYEIKDAEDANADTITRIGRYFSGLTGRGAGAFDPDLNVFVRTAIAATNAVFYFWDLGKAGPDNRNVLFAPVDAAGQWKLDRGYGMDFDPIRGQYLLWGGTGDVWAMRAPATVSAQGWTIERLPGPNSVAAPVSNYNGSTQEPGGGVLGKWKYIPELDAFVGLQDTAAGNVWIYKPVGWTRPGTTPAPTLNINVTPDRIFSGDDVVVSWRTKGATTCIADGSWTGSKSVQGVQTIASVMTEAHFELLCDGPGGSIRRVATVTVNSLAPPTINTISGDSCINAAESSAGLTVAGTGKAGATVLLTAGAITRSATVDSQNAWQATLTSDDVMSLPDGVVNVSASQASGDATSSTFTYPKLTKDTIAPGGTTSAPRLVAASDTGTSATDGVTRDATPTFQGRASTAATPVALLLNGVIGKTVNANSAGDWTATTAALAPKQYSVTAAVADACGNQGTQSSETILTVDSVAPALLVEAVTADNRINLNEAQQGVSIRGTAESNASVLLRISAGSSQLLSRQLVSAGTWVFDLTAPEMDSFPQGALTLYVNAADAAGNTRAVTRTIYKDTVLDAPAINAIAGDDVISGSERNLALQVSGRAEAKAVVTLSVNGWTRRATATADGTWSTEVPSTVVGQLPVGTLPFAARATDAAGNISSTSVRNVTVQD
jgi:hypothetical protein